MMAVQIAYDEVDGFARVIVTHHGKICDLYFEKLGEPNLTGAIVCAQTMRVMKGDRAYFDFGMAGYGENMTGLRVGQRVILSVKSPARGDKAAMLGAYPGAGDFPNDKTGIIKPPPKIWQRAIADCGEDKILMLNFSVRDAWDDCHAQYPNLHHVLQPIAKTPAHPDFEIEDFLNPRVPLPCGGNIFIEQTSAFVSIDVNGGDVYNPIIVNNEAAKVAAEQIRLRNLSGIIIMDCLKMKNRTDNEKMVQAMRKATSDDYAGVTVSGMTKLGLIEMTRPRRGHSLMELMG